MLWWTIVWQSGWASTGVTHIPRVLDSIPCSASYSSLLLMANKRNSRLNVQVFGFLPLMLKTHKEFLALLLHAFKEWTSKWKSFLLSLVHLVPFKYNGNKFHLQQGVVAGGIRCSIENLFLLTLKALVARQWVLPTFSQLYMHSRH